MSSRCCRVSVIFILYRLLRRAISCLLQQISRREILQADQFLDMLVGLIVGPFQKASSTILYLYLAQRKRVINSNSWFATEQGVPY